MPDNRIENIDDLKTWVAAHDGRIDAWWDTQHKWNVKVERELLEMDKRLTTLEKRIILVAAVMSGIGTTIGQLIVRGMGL